MSFQFRKTAILAFLMPAYAGAILYWDRGYFLPLGTHSDWRFQITGEVVELLVLVALWAVSAILGRRRSTGAGTRKGDEAVIFGACMAVFQLAFRWRSMFVNGHFSGFETQPLVTESLLEGSFSGAFYFLWPSLTMKKPSPEEEKSVV